MNKKLNIQEEWVKDFTSLCDSAYDNNGERQPFEFERLKDFIKSLFEKEKEKTIKKIADKLIKIEKDKFKDEIHCTCLGYAIVKIFGDKYEERLK